MFHYNGNMKNSILFRFYQRRKHSKKHRKFDFDSASITPHELLGTEQRWRKSWKGWLPRIYDCSRKQTGCADAFERGKTDSECTLARCGGFSRRLCPFHGRATPDFEAAFVCSIGPLPAWHVERSRKSLKWLLVFAPAISSLLRIGNVLRSKSIV